MEIESEKRSFAMKKRVVWFAALALFSAEACTSAASGGKPGSSSDADTDADTDADADSDTEIDTDLEGEWCDGEADLCWQNPVEDVEMNWYHAAGESHITLNPYGAVDYCGDLVWAGHSDWRLPEIDELIGLIRGCQAGDTTGQDECSECGVVDPDCLDYTCKEDDPNCEPCPYLEGPDDDPPGCFWEPELRGPCAESDKAYWSVSPYTHDPDYAWMVYFPAAAVVDGELESKALVRCVRDGEGPD